MEHNDLPYAKISGTIRWGAAAITLVTLVAIGSLIRIHLDSTLDWIIALVTAAGLSGVSNLLAGSWLSKNAVEYELQTELRESTKRVDHLQARLTFLQKLNGILANAQEERSLMEDVLSLVGDFVGAQALSYVPLDEWGQPLASVLRGEAPAGVLEKWFANLSNPSVAQICRHCQIRRSNSSTCCPLAGHPFSGIEGIYCLPVRRADRLLGMLNLYLAPPASLSEDMTSFLENLLEEMALAVETVRLRNQELVTLRQLQLVRNPRLDLPSLLTGLLDHLKQTVEVDHALLLARIPGRSGAQFILGNDLPDQLESERLQTFMERVIVTGEALSLVEENRAALPAGMTSIAALPLSITKEKPYGVLAVARSKPAPFHPQEMRMLETVASQAVLLIENDRLVNEVEYKAVIEERVRLAREIHDGLAQTLAFLKLQIGQLQNALRRGDLDRSMEIARVSHQTLSDAYLDAREAIDNLRISPNEPFQLWLKQVVDDFRSTTNLDTRLAPMSITPDLLPEVHAQIIRVVQEALSNIRKHAHAKRVDVSFRSWQGDWILEISDDGRGFSPDEIPSLSQYGLRGMRERAEMIGADFQIISQPNSGTTVRLRLPKPIEETPV